jgi:hypothetical protein
MPFDPATAAAAAGKGLEVLLQYLQGERQQQNYEQSIARAKQERDAALRMAKEGRGDVFGNRVVYKPGIGWTYELTPRGKELVSGDELAKLRAQELSRQGGEDYQTARSKYLYGPRESQAGLEDEFTRLLQLGRKKGLEEGGSVVARQALRMNMGNQIPRIIDEIEKRYGQTLEESMLRGKQLGREEFRTGERFRTEQGGNDLTRFFSQATSPYASSGLGTSLGNQASAAGNDLTRALTSGSSGVDAAYRALAGYGGPNLDLSGLGSAIGALLKPAPTQESTYPKTQARLFPSGGTV